MAPLSFGTSPHSTTLRQAMTEAERAMWFALRDRRLGDHKFRRPVAVGAYVVDLLCAQARLVVEMDGGQHTPEIDAHRTSVIEAKRISHCPVLEQRCSVQHGRRA